MTILIGLDPAKIEVGMIVKARVIINEHYFGGHIEHHPGKVGIVTEVETLKWPRKGEIVVTVQFEEFNTVVSPPVPCRSEWLLPV